MRRSGTRSRLSAVALVVCGLTVPGCAYLRVPRIDPTGERIFVEPPIVATPRYQAHPGPPLPGDDVGVTLSPQFTVAPVGSEAVLVAGVLGPDGYLRTNRRLEWSLAAGGVGSFVAVGSSGPVDPKELTAKMKAFIEGLEPDLELAEKYDSYLAIENHGHALLDSLDSFKAFVDVNTHPRLGISMAPYHLQGRKVSVEEAIAVTGKQLFFFYAWQRARGTGQLPGIGPTDFTPWIAALAKAGYRWYVNPFMHHEPEPDAMSEALAKSRDYLQECYQKAVVGSQ